MFLCAQGIPAQTAPYALSLGYQFGFLYGQAEEVVYPSGTKGELLSQLLWDMKPVFYNGLKLDFSQTAPMSRWGFFSTFSLKYGIPGFSGKMEDRDWMSEENASLTSFSSHDNKTKEIFIVDFSAGLSFPLSRFLLLKPFITVSYMRFSFSGMDGSGMYARGNPPNSGTYYPIDDNPDRATFSGKVISYTQEWMYIAPGFSLVFVIRDRFSAAVSFQISPLFSYSGLDEHYYSSVDISPPVDPSANKQFMDYTQGGLLLQPGMEISFSPFQWLSLSLDCSWRYIKRTRGESYNRYYGRGFYNQDGEGGAGLSVIDTSLLVTVRLTNNEGKRQTADSKDRLAR